MQILNGTVGIYTLSAVWDVVLNLYALSLNLFTASVSLDSVKLSILVTVK